MTAKNLQDELVARLAKHRGKHTKIARECQLAQATVSRVASGTNSPTLVVAQRLFDWLDAAEGAKKPKARRAKPTAETI